MLTDSHEFAKIEMYTFINSQMVIPGSVWVYGTWGKVHADTYMPCPKVNATEGCTPGTCNETLLTFSFAVVTVDWVFTALWIMFVGRLILLALAKRFVVKARNSS